MPTSPFAKAVLKAASISRAQSNPLKVALGDHRNRSRNSRDRVLSQRRCDGRDAAAGALRQDLLDRPLRDEDEPFEVRGDKTTEFLNGVIREGFQALHPGHESLSHP